MPLSITALLNIVQENADEDGDKRVWLAWHIDVTLAIIFGGTQFKEGAALWPTKRVGINYHKIVFRGCEDIEHEGCLKNEKN
jgi:hypothetical protein